MSYEDYMEMYEKVPIWHCFLCPNIWDPLFPGRQAFEASGAQVLYL